MSDLDYNNAYILLEATATRDHYTLHCFSQPLARLCSGIFVKLGDDFPQLLLGCLVRSRRSVETSIASAARTEKFAR